MFILKYYSFDGRFIDGSFKAQMGISDMRLAIQYALTYPNRIELPIEKLDLIELGQFTFEKPDEERFPALRLTREAGRQVGLIRGD